MSNLRILLWIYLVLLIFEGALRKWVVPALDAPLLVIRDPLVMLIYYQAWQNRLSFQNAFFIPNLVLAVMTAIIATLFGSGNVLVTVYGLRTDYLQIPLIFLMPQILNRDDVIAMGRFLFYVSIPFTILIVLQFHSPTDSFWNKGAMLTHYGTVRPSGTFSFISGPVAFYPLVVAFLFFGFSQAHTYKWWLLAAVTLATLIASAFSGSRSGVVSIGLVVVTAILCALVQGKGGRGIVVATVLIGLAVPLLSSIPVVHDGLNQLILRFEDTAASGEDTEGFMDRYAITMVGPFSDMEDLPLFGHGLGLGTNAAAGMLRGDRGFIGPESEWGRLIFECGTIFGVLLCLFRVALTFFVARRVFEAFRRGNLLPVLIYSSCGLLVLNGQWGVPTTLGFAIFGAGITLAAGVEPEEYEDDYEEYDDQAEDGAEHSATVDTVG